MHPVICQIGPFTIYSYGLAVAVAFLLSAYLTQQQAKSEALNPQVISNLVFIVFISGIAGARLLYVAEHFRYYASNLLEIPMLQRGGLSWYGGLLFAIFSAIVYLKKKKQDLYVVMDTVVPFVALGQAVGRVGCLLNGCCFGRVSQYGLYFPVQEAALIPTQLYSSLLLLSIFIVLRSLQDRPHQKGEIFFTYLLLYSLKRFFIEFYRADNYAVWFHLSLFQLVSLAFFSFSCLKLFLIKKS